MAHLGIFVRASGPSVASSGLARPTMVDLTHPTEISTNGKLRLYFITEDDPLYVIRFFEVFFAEYPRDEFEILGMTIQAPFNESRLQTAVRVLRAYGLLDFFRLLRRVGARKARRRTIAAIARLEGVDVMQTESVNDPIFVRRIRKLEPDVIVSIAAPEIFRRDLLESARRGCVNLHSGRLPVYRGMMPSFWQMHSGETHATVTVHEMAEKLDAGAVLGTVEYPIGTSDTLDHVMTETKRAGARLMIRVLRELASGDLTPRRLDMAQASYFTFPKRREVKELLRRGHRLF